MMSVSPVTLNPGREDDPASLSRAASYDELAKLPATEKEHPGLRRTFSDVTSPSTSSPPSKESVITGKDILRRTSLRSKTKTTTTNTSFTLPEDRSTHPACVGSENDALDVPRKPSCAQAEEESEGLKRPLKATAPPAKTRSMSGRLARFARKSWMLNSSSRSPSPLAKTRERQLREQAQLPTKSSARCTQKLNSSDACTESSSEQPSRKRKAFNKRPRRPRLAVITQDGTRSVPSSPSWTSLRSISSLEKLAPILPSFPKVSSADRLRKTDELWSTFRCLEADYQKFQSKSSVLKANVIRTSLFPFLNQRRPCTKLRPEDLDRRVTILNKWWTGLLEILNGKNKQSISGTDRPIFLEAILGIMARPEWRAPFPLSQHMDNQIIIVENDVSSESVSSDGSSGSEFLIESIYHNIRNIFTQNLLSQMTFVVERMSMRHVPASLTTFCGKTCAYAFTFCPGVADILVRLWNTSSDGFRRVLSELGASRNKRSRTFVQELASNFPVALQTLSFHSHVLLARYLRQKPDVPLNTVQIPWQGPWVSRWCGRDTDLFFFFVKHIHILFTDFIPSNTAKCQRIFAPGLLPIHAQLLVLLEETLCKQPSHQISENPSGVAAVTFDDFIEGADATISGLSLGAANSRRSMAENRLVMLLRDFLSQSSVEAHSAQLFFAECFGDVMKAAVRKTSLFNHNSCFALCDFIEEVVPIISRYSRSVDVEVFDWKYWLSVCRRMMKSQNSLTEIRVFSLLFCIWNTWVATEERLSDVCLDMLLQPSFFYEYFHHWNPMVRAYFHRLLCWRVARCNGDPSPLHSKIYEILSQRLGQSWEYYLEFQSIAEKQATAPLSSAPCTPAPGRRIIIIRCEERLPSPSLLVSFDRGVLPMASEQPTACRTHGVFKLDASEPEPQAAQKKRWGIFRAMLGVTSGSKPNQKSPPGSSSGESDTSTPDQNSPSDQSPDTSALGKPCLDGPQTAKQPYRPSSFKFSLEWSDRPQWAIKNKRLFNPYLPVQAQLHLQLRRSANQPQQHDGYSDDSAFDQTSASVATAGGDSDSTSSSKTSEVVAQQNEPLQPSTWRGSPSNADRYKPFSALDPLIASKYAGRALAEWAQIVSECDGFFSRRRDEGVPSDKLVETPILGVESFRK